MCGIVGIASKNKDIAVDLVCRLQRLQYRGYDSAGCALIVENTTFVKKTIGKVGCLLNSVVASKIESNIGIAHTRWATHGGVNLKNAHPQSFKGFFVVHNGIMENAFEIKNTLKNKGYSFCGSTDTEVMLKLAFEYAKENNCDLPHALHHLTQSLTGTFTSLFLLKSQPNRIFAIKKGSSLVIAKGKSGCIVASDIHAVHGFAKEVVHLDDNDIAVISHDGFDVFNNKKQIKKEVSLIDNLTSENTKKEHESFMIKEILEQPKMLRRILQNFDFDKVKNSITTDQVSLVYIVACGSSFFAALIAKTWIEKYWGIEAKAEIASEFECKISTDKKLFILVSQSGETADTMCALQKIKNNGGNTIAFVNNPHSALARDCDFALQTNAGVELSVAATKTFTAQLISFLCLILTKMQNPNPFFDAFSVLQGKIEDVISKIQHQLDLASEKITAKTKVLYTGKGNGYYIAKEGALKIKELCYIMTESIAAGELKHGTIALIDNSVYVVVIAPYDQFFDKIFSNIQEIASRGGKLIIFTDRQGNAKLKKLSADIFELPDTCAITMPIVYAVAMQLFAYNVAKKQKRDIDHPRNLAKAITVE